MNGFWMAAICCLWVLLLAIAVTQLGLLRRVGPLLGQPRHDHAAEDGIGPGGRPADFQAVTATGEQVDRSILLGEPTLVLMSNRGCPPCDRLAAELRRQGTAGLGARLVVISDDDADEYPRGVRVLRQLDDSARQAFGTWSTPALFLLDADGVVRANRLVNSMADITDLTAEVLTSH